MSLSFVPTRAFLWKRILRQSAASCVSTAPQRRCIAASLTGREKRRAAEQARNQAHRDIKQEIENKNDLVSAVVSLPAFVRDRCLLSSRLSRVKVFLEKEDLEDFSMFRGRVRLGLVRVFPELELRGLLGVSDGFDMKVAGGDVRDVDDLRQGLQKCENRGTDVYVELIPHNTPPPKPPLSTRVKEVADRARDAASDPSSTLHMISFYKFVDIARPDIVSGSLEKKWSRMGIKGRVYVATEGVNAQLAVPASVLKDFHDMMSGSWTERGESLVPSELKGIFLNTDTIVPQSEQPFQKLSVRPREKVLADGFDEALDWNRSGEEIAPKEWHRTLTENPENMVLLDCRNDYESDVGRFEGASPLNTRTFRESWDELEKQLQHEDRSKRILTYCTGGIRCVKVNAFLEQKMGFTNTGRLEGGIVSYARTLREDGKLKESKFKGVNHVFDGRMGEVVTSDLLHQCINCGQSCNTQTDCSNVSCPREFDSRMFVQCEDCANVMQGACSDACKASVTMTGVLPENGSRLVSSHSQSQSISSTQLMNEQYADLFSMREDPLLAEIRKKTDEQFSARTHMLSSHTQASFLKMLVQISNASKVLEIGTFTGYSAMAMATGLPSEGKLTACEIDVGVAAVASGFFAKSSHGAKIELRTGAALKTLESLIEEGRTFDFAFIDADKGGYKEYLDTLLGGELVRVGGLLVFDNVLFRGEVAQLELGNIQIDESQLIKQRMRSVRESRKIARKIHNFNTHIRDDDRVEQLLLPFRDGLTIARRVR